MNSWERQPCVTTDVDAIYLITKTSQLATLKIEEDLHIFRMIYFRFHEFTHMYINRIDYYPGNDIQ